jgi:non-specific serine/threonine protein kinase
MTLYREMGEPYGVALGLDGLGLVAQAQGDYARAAALYEEGLALYRAEQDRYGTAWSLQYLGLVAQAQGDHARAGALYREGLALRREMGDAAGVAQCLEGLATVAGAQDQAERAARLFGAAAALRASIGAPLSPTERADYEPTLAAARARLGEDAFAAASTEGRVMPLEQAVVYALAAADPAGAPPSPPREPAVTGHLTLLSRREREVAVLIARGLTNRQIADELVITEWTADSHVRHILTKLGVRSRTQVAAWATEQGLIPPEPR